MALGYSLQVVLGGRKESGVVTRHNFTIKEPEEPAGGCIKRSPHDLLANMDRSLLSVAAHLFSFHVSDSHDKRTAFTY